MRSILYELKGQATILNFILVLVMAALILYRYKKRNAAITLSVLAILVLLLCSTDYLPRYFAARLEKKYLPFNPVVTNDTNRVLIHVLGSGYSLDNRLPPNAQLGPAAIARLAEAIRLHRLMKNSVIICSGYSSLGLETQAQVTRRAAIVLGVDSSSLETLNNPSTTQEEAKELARMYGQKSRVVIVTDAIHMDRAMKLFRKVGFHPIAAPTNFKVNEGPQQYGMKWWPSAGNIVLMNYVVHEWLGDLKSGIRQ